MREEDIPVVQAEDAIGGSAIRRGADAPGIEEVVRKISADISLIRQMCVPEEKHIISPLSRKRRKGVCRIFDGEEMAVA